MSIESAKAYMERLKTDEEFRDRISMTPDRGVREDFIKAEGFDWDDEDIMVAVADLTDRQLEAVGGGACRLAGGVARCGEAWDRQTLECSAANAGGETCGAA